MPRFKSCLFGNLCKSIKRRKACLGKKFTLGNHVGDWEFTKLEFKVVSPENLVFDDDIPAVPDTALRRRGAPRLASDARIQISPGPRHTVFFGQEYLVELRTVSSSAHGKKEVKAWNDATQMVPYIDHAETKYELRPISYCALGSHGYELA